MSHAWVPSSDGCGNDLSHRARRSLLNTWLRFVRRCFGSRCPPLPTLWRGRVLQFVLSTGTCPWVPLVPPDRKDPPDLLWVYGLRVPRRFFFDKIIALGVTSIRTLAEINCYSMFSIHCSFFFLPAWVKCKHIVRVWTGLKELKYLAEKLGMKTLRFSTSPWGQIRSHRLDTWSVLNGFWRVSRLSLDWKAFSTLLHCRTDSCSTTSLITTLINALEAMTI